MHADVKMDPWWVRCGNCFSFTSPLTSTSIFLTSCGHFVCNYCLQKSPLSKQANSGYCYDCKKPCSVVNLNQGDKLSPDIAFYFKDPSTMFQKMIEIENFQKLHRNRRQEDAIKKRLINDIVQVRAFRERSEKYLPYLGQIYSTLCSRYSIKLTNQHIEYSPAQIDTFVRELKEIQRRQELFQPCSNSAAGSDKDGSVMEVDGRTHSAQVTPVMRGLVSPAGQVSSGCRTPVGTDRGVGNLGTPKSMFRARVQSEMRGDSLSQYGGSTPPNHVTKNKPSPLVGFSQAAPTGQQLPAQLQQHHTNAPTGQQLPAQFLHQHANITAGQLLPAQYQPSSFTPAHAQMHLRLPNSVPVSRSSAMGLGPRLLSTPMELGPRLGVTPLITPVQAGVRHPMGAALGTKQLLTPMGVGARQLIPPRKRSLATPMELGTLATPVGSSTRPLQMSRRVNSPGTAVMLSSVQRKPQLSRMQCSHIIISHCYVDSNCNYFLLLQSLMCQH